LRLGFNSPSSAFELCGIALGQTLSLSFRVLKCLDSPHCLFNKKYTITKLWPLKKNGSQIYNQKKEVVANCFIKKMTGVAILHTPSYYFKKSKKIKILISMPSRFIHLGITQPEQGILPLRDPI